MTTENEINRLCGILKNQNIRISDNAFKRTIQLAEDKGETDYAVKICENKSPEVYPTVIIRNGTGRVYPTIDAAKEVIVNDNLTVYSVAG